MSDIGNILYTKIRAVIYEFIASSFPPSVFQSGDNMDALYPLMVLTGFLVTFCPFKMLGPCGLQGRTLTDLKDIFFDGPGFELGLYGPGTIDKGIN